MFAAKLPATDTRPAAAGWRGACWQPCGRERAPVARHRIANSCRQRRKWQRPGQMRGTPKSFAPWHPLSRRQASEGSSEDSVNGVNGGENGKTESVPPLRRPSVRADPQGMQPGSTRHRTLCYGRVAGAARSRQRLKRFSPSQSNNCACERPAAVAARRAAGELRRRNRVLGRACS